MAATANAKPRLFGGYGEVGSGIAANEMQPAVDGYALARVFIGGCEDRFFGRHVRFSTILS